jgi:outer membrane protein TolC
LQQFTLEATYLTLTSNIALAAIQEASLRAQIEETVRAIDDEKLLAKGERFHKSFTSASARDWAALRAAIAQAEQTIPLLQKQLAAQRDQLAALTGHFAGAGLLEHFTLAKLQLPKSLPVMLPSQIVERRPDVRAAQANLHAAGALVGVAIANRIPLFNLTGNIGRTSSHFNNLLSPAPEFLFWNIAGSVTQTAFDGFTLEQRQRAAESGWDQAAEQYSSTVVNAFQNVAAALQAIEFDRESLHYANVATRAARKNLCLTVAGFVGYNGTKNYDLKRISKRTDAQLMREIRRIFGAWWEGVCRSYRPYHELQAGLSDSGDGAPSGIDVVTSEQLYLTTQLSRVVAMATQYADVVALFQALGGGWWNRSDVEQPEERRSIGGPRSWSAQQ